MNPDYVKGVSRFALPGRLKNETGSSFNISHNDNLPASDFQTDGKGHVISSPLVWRKPCHGRLERFLRESFGGRSWTDESGERHLSDTSCDTCLERSPHTHQACLNIVTERLESSAAVHAAFNAWLDACEDLEGSACYDGTRAPLWQALLRAIRDHGGWTNVNDDQVKLEALRLQEEGRAKRNFEAKERRSRERQARRGLPVSVTNAFLQALQTERDCRAAKLKSLRGLSGRTSRSMLWLANLPDATCERIADVWQARELLSRGGPKVTGKAIAELLIRWGRPYGLSVGSLTTRVHEDLARIAKLEDDRAGAPLWALWTSKDIAQAA